MYLSFVGGPTAACLLVTGSRPAEVVHPTGFVARETVFVPVQPTGFVQQMGFGLAAGFVGFVQVLGTEVDCGFVQRAATGSAIGHWPKE